MERKLASIMADKYKTLFVISGLTIIILAVFGQVSSFEFVNYDDDKYVSENNHILTGFAWDNVVWIFTNQHGGHWHPLTGLSHMLDCELFSLKAGWHHLVNVLFHIANALLLFVVLRQMTGALWQSAFVAVLFAIHPLHVESVAWISERKDVLSTLFWILTMTAYFHYVKNPKNSTYILTLALFALGLMAKPMLITLPFVLLLLDYWPLNRFAAKSADISRQQEKHHGDSTAVTKLRIGLQLLYEKIPFFVVTVISSIVTFFVYRNMAMVTSYQTPLSIRIANTVVSYVKYIEQMIWPKDLAMFYPYPENKLPQWQVIASAMLLVLITFLVIRLTKKYRYLAVGWLWYLGTLVPVIGIVRAGDQFMADRYTYVSLTGLFIIIAWGTADLLAKWKYKRTVLCILSIAVILVLSLCAWFQTGFWHNNISLFGHAINVTSGNYLAYNNRGTVYYNKGELDEALSDYNKAIEFNQKYVDAYNNRGNVYRDKGEYERAISDYNKALEINPRYVEAYYNRGNACWDKGEYDLAISDYNKALEINPMYADVYNNRGNAYKHKGQLDLAIPDYSKAIEINPKSAESYYNRAACYAQGKGEYDLAISDYSKAIEINPLYIQAYFNRGNAYYSKGQLDYAIADYDKTIEIDPTFGIAYLSKADVCENSGRKKEAISAYEAFIRCASAEYTPYIEQVRQRIKDLEQQQQ